MPKKKEITAEKLVDLYMDYITNNGEPPESIFEFCETAKIQEKLFYVYFTSIKAIEKEIFKSFFTNTFNLISSSGDYYNFDTKNKLITFYFSFFELLNVNSGAVKPILNKNKLLIQSLPILSDLRTEFKLYILSLEMLESQVIPKELTKKAELAVQELFWIQFIATLNFWLKDESENFEKTDIYIEKSLKAGFELLDFSALKSVFDFGKFIWSENKWFK